MKTSRWNVKKRHYHNTQISIIFTILIFICRNYYTILNNKIVIMHLFVKSNQLTVQPTVPCDVEWLDLEYSCSYRHPRYAAPVVQEKPLIDPTACMV
jgi:hypothetical protein